MNRRNFLGASSLLLTGCVTGVGAGDSASLANSGEKLDHPPIVLVHGAWHGGWCWATVAEKLRKLGFPVYTPTLTGLGERAHLRNPVPDLSMHIEDVVRVIEWNELDNVILVGHSYGGMVITGVVDRLKDRMQHVVYLDAALPEDGESMLTQNPAVGPENADAVAAELKKFAPDGVWMASVPPEVLGIPSDRQDLVSWVKRRLTPHPYPTWVEPISLTSGGSEGLPRTYIHCVEPVLARASFPAHAKRIQNGEAGSGWRYSELKTGHDAMLTDPEGVVREIIAVLG